MISKIVQKASCAVYTEFFFFSFRFTEIVRRLTVWRNCESVLRTCELCAEIGGNLRTVSVAAHRPSLLVAGCRYSCVYLGRGCD